MDAGALGVLMSRVTERLCPRVLKSTLSPRVSYRRVFNACCVCWVEPCGLGGYLIIE